MALVFVDSFDHYTTLAQKWDASSGTIDAAYGRFGKGLCVTQNAVVHKATANMQTWFVGLAFKTGTQWPNDYFLALRDSGALQVEVRINTAGQLVAARNGTALATVEAPLAFSTWYYIELAAYIHDTAGTLTVRVNGASVITLSGVDTKNTANAYANQLALRSPNNGNALTMIDDLYICDGAGSTNNSLLGDCKVVALLPSGAGASTDWTPSAGANYECVDEATPDDDTTYVSSATAGHKDTYALGDLSGSGTVYGVQALYRVRKDDAGTRTVKSVLRSGAGTEANGTSNNVGDTYGYYADVFDAEPGGAAWTVAKVNDAQAGVVVEA